MCQGPTGWRKRARQPPGRTVQDGVGIVVGPPSEAAAEAVVGWEAEVTTEVTTVVEGVAVDFSMAEGGVAATTTKPHLLFCILKAMCHLFDFFFTMCISSIGYNQLCVSRPGIVLSSASIYRIVIP